MDTNTFACSDGQSYVDIVAASPQEAAREFVGGGTWGDGSETVWVLVDVTGPDNAETRHRITIHPDVPSCADGRHFWVRTGTKGSGGGVVYSEECTCDQQRTVNTWASCPVTGEQGLTHVKYWRHDY